MGRTNTKQLQALMIGKGELSTLYIIEPPRGKTNNVVSEQIRHKPACTSTEKC